MGYGWCTAHRVYGFSGTLESGDFIELSENTLEKMGLDVFVESVYKNMPCGVVYGIEIEADGVVDPDSARKVVRALDYVNKKYSLAYAPGYHLCVDTDMVNMDGSDDSFDSSEVSEESEDSDKE